MARGRNGAVAQQLRTLFHLGTVRELTDGQLLERFATAGGETAELAFAALVERHGPMVLRVCRGILADPHDTQDAFQATFLVLVKKARGLWVRDSLGPWLHQVAYRTASCARLTMAHRRRHEQGAAVLRTEAQVEVHDDLARVLHEEIERLPERFRAPLVLCDLEGAATSKRPGIWAGRSGRSKAGRLAVGNGCATGSAAAASRPMQGVLAAALRPDGASALVSPRTRRFHNPGGRSACLVSHVCARVRCVTCPGSFRFHVLHPMVESRVGAPLPGRDHFRSRLAGPEGNAGRSAAAGETLQAADARRSADHAVKPGKLSVTVVERGSLEASRNAGCVLPGRGPNDDHLASCPRGRRSRRARSSVELDSASLKDQLVNQMITVKAAEANYENAKLAREVAEIAVIEYVDGIYKHEQDNLEGCDHRRPVGHPEGRRPAGADPDCPQAGARLLAAKGAASSARRYRGRARHRRPPRIRRADSSCANGWHSSRRRPSRTCSKKSL